MKINELIVKYDFHDSIVKKIDYLKYKKKVIIKIEFCNWKQVNYKESQPELIECLLSFEGVTEFMVEPINEEFEDDEILEVNCFWNEEIEKEDVKIVSYGESGIKVINFSADKVEYSL